VSEPKPNPDRDANGLPLCDEERCALHDGKRCRALGFRPDRFCEPVLVEMATELKALRDVVAKAEAKADEILRAVSPRRARDIATTIEAPPPDDLLDRITPEHACRHTRRNLRPNPHGVPVTTCIDCGDAIP